MNDQDPKLQIVTPNRPKAPRLMRRLMRTRTVEGTGTTLGIPEEELDALRALNRNEVEYLLIGGYAMRFFGRRRRTKDVDVLTNNSIENTRKLFDAVREILGYTPRLVVENDVAISVVSKQDLLIIKRNAVARHPKRGNKEHADIDFIEALNGRRRTTSR